MSIKNGFNAANDFVDKPGVIAGILGIFSVIFSVLIGAFGRRDMKHAIDDSFERNQK